MSLTFIIFGLILILFIFGVARASNLFELLLILLGSSFVLIGYFCGTKETSLMSINLFHLIAFILFSVLFFDKKLMANAHVVMLMLFASTMVLYFDSGYLLFYSGVLYFLMASILFIIYNTKISLLLSTLSLFTFAYLLIDGVFQYFELQYVFIDFDFIFLVLFFLYAFGKIFAYLDANKITFKGAYYGK